MFRIAWTESAISSLTEGWALADSRLRSDITAAAHEIDRRLALAPDRVGESREAGTRVLIIPPLAVTFHVNVRMNSVLISGVVVHRRSGK